MVTTTPPLATAAHLLRCPVCRGTFQWGGRTLGCATGHTFDVAKQGYVNLLGRAAPANADTAAMLDARARVLASGLFDEVRQAVAEASEVGSPDVIVEVGAGTGFYLQAALQVSPGALGLALDISPVAARRCASSGLAAVVADTWQPLPLADGCTSALLCVFAPRNPAEFARIMAPDGQVIVATPGPGHLAEIRERFGLLDLQHDKTRRLHESFAEGGLKVDATKSVQHDATPSAELLADLVAMGPNAFHDHAEVDAAELAVQIDVEVTVFTR